MLSTWIWVVHRYDDEKIYVLRSRALQPEPMLGSQPCHLGTPVPHSFPCLMETHPHVAAPLLLHFSLQGFVTPQLLCHGMLSLTDAFFLALSDEGQDLHTRYVRISRGLRCQVKEAVQALHEAGICHREVRASNILQRGDGKVRIVDFECARLLQQPRTKSDLADIKADLDAVGAL